jgi:hypothetical protein
MSRHEMQAVWGLYPLCQILIDQGVLPHDRLLAGLKELRDDQADMGAANAAAMVDFIISQIKPPRSSWWRWARTGMRRSSARSRSS